MSLKSKTVNSLMLQEAESLVQEAHKTAGEGWRGPTVDKELARSVEFHQGSIGDAIEKANSDNARIYFQRVPSSVPQVQAAVMVNSTNPPGGRPHKSKLHHSMQSVMELSDLQQSVRATVTDGNSRRDACQRVSKCALCGSNLQFQNDSWSWLNNHYLRYGSDY